MGALLKTVLGFATGGPVGGAIGAVAVVVIATSAIFWRCPACDGSLGQYVYPRRCPRCDAVLHD